MTMLRVPLSCARILALASLVVVSAAAPLPAIAQAQMLPNRVPPQMRNEAMALMQICRADYDRLCNNVQPGGGRILACLQNHAGQLASACGQAMSRAQALNDAAAAAGVLPK
jgi:Cysteine rich repeat